MERCRATRIPASTYGNRTANLQQAKIQLIYLLDMSGSTGKAFEVVRIDGKNVVKSRRREVMIGTLIKSIKAAKENFLLNRIAEVYVYVFKEDVQTVIDGTILGQLDVDTLEQALKDIPSSGHTLLGKALKQVLTGIQTRLESYASPGFVVPRSMFVLITDGVCTDELGRPDWEGAKEPKRILDQMFRRRQIVFLPCGVHSISSRVQFFRELEWLVENAPTDYERHVYTALDQEELNRFLSSVGRTQREIARETLREIRNLAVNEQKNDPEAQE